MAATPLPSTCLILPLPNSPSRSSFCFSVTLGSDITDDLLKLCADLFSNNYGVWGPSADTISKYTKPGQPVKMTGSRLRTECLPVPEKTILVTCFRVDPDTANHLVGHAFVSVWDYSPSGDITPPVSVAWVTQLVVDKTVRRRYIATSLLQTLKSHALFRPVKIIGLVSSHPAACNTLAKCASADFCDINLAFIRDNAEGILASSNVGYLKAAPLRGAVFEENCDSGAVSSVFTKFYVDHTEPLEALAQYKGKGRWSLGDLPDGHEFLLFFPLSSA